MGRLLFVDAVGGAAGDMLLAALLDAGAPPESVRDAVDAVLPGRFAIGLEQVVRGGLRAALLRIEPLTGSAPEASTMSPQAMRSAVESAALESRVRDRAIAVLERLTHAERRVHRNATDEVELHELGDEDTIIDVVGVLAAIDALEVDRVLVGPLPLQTGGTVQARGHGDIPLPAPVTLELLKGFDLRLEPGGSETVTPTAAAILAELGTPAPLGSDLRLEAVGYGAGTRDPDARPNVVRLLLAAADDSEDGARAGDRPLLVLEANLDDLTPELVADAAEELFAAGALDVWTAPIHMKKGRAAVTLSALTEPAGEARVREAFFRTTSTFGVRAHEVRRAELERRIATVEVEGATIRVKVGLLGGAVVTVTPEHDDVAAVARRAGKEVREVYEQAVGAARVLRLESEEASR